MLNFSDFQRPPKETQDQTSKENLKKNLFYVLEQSQLLLNQILMPYLKKSLFYLMS